MLKIFHAPPTRSLRVVWLCEEMGVPYEIAPVRFGEKPPELLAVNPLGTVPVLQDGALTMNESVAMMLYIMGRYGPTELAVEPSDPRYGDYVQNLLFGEAGLAMYCSPLIATKFRAPEELRSNWTADYALKTLLQRLAVLDAALGEGPYLLGDRFTAADVSVGYTIGIVHHAGAGEGVTPRLRAYRERLKARPAYRRATAVAAA